MNWEAIGAIGEIVGALAVVASLLYLAIQTRANANALRANAVWNAETIFAHQNYAHAKDPIEADLIARVSVAEAKLEDFTDTEINQLHLLVRGAMQMLQAQYSLWKEGALPDELWERRRNWTRAFVSLPLIYPIWENESVQFIVSPEFKKDIESGLEENVVSIGIGKSASGT